MFINNKVMKTQDDIQTILLPVLGMTCAACANSVESMIGAQQGVEQAEVNYATQTVKVSYHPDQVQPPAFQKAVQSIGYDLIMDSENGKEKQEEVQQKNYSSLKRRMIASGILALPVVLIGMFFMDIPYANTTCWH